MHHGRVLSVPSRVLHARRTTTSWDVLVFWEGMDSTDASWEPVEEFKVKYPDFKLEDELFSTMGGSVMDTVFGKQYSRLRKKDKDPISG
jgi:hypothetical protein